jgi:hypothetical protein
MVGTWERRVPTVLPHVWSGAHTCHPVLTHVCREVETDEFQYNFTTTEKPHVQNDTVTLHRRYAQVTGTAAPWVGVVDLCERPMDMSTCNRHSGTSSSPHSVLTTQHGACIDDGMPLILLLMCRTTR